MIRTVFSGLTVVLALLAAPLPAYAQETTGEIRGQILVSGTDADFIVPVRLYDSIGNLVTERRNFRDGSFNFLGLTPGTYHVQAGDQWYSGKASFAESDPVLVAPGGSAQGIDFTFDFNDLGWIEGRVYDAETGEAACVTIAEHIRPRGDGTYTLGLYPGSSWKISFLDNCEFDYATQWWDGKPDEASADVINVTGGEVITGIDAAMRPPEDPGGWISGTVIDAETGDKVGGICPIPYDETGEQVEFAPSTQYSPAPSAQDGTYRIGFLGEGTFRVWFVDCLNHVYEALWWREGSSFEEADPISVALGEEVSGINIFLELMPGKTRPESTSDQGGPPGPVQGAGGSEPEVQSDRLPFTGPEQPLGLLASLATVILGIGLMLVSSSRRTPHPGD